MSARFRENMPANPRPDTATADALACVAELIRSGLPTPDSITLGGTQPRLWVRSTDLIPWLEALDVVDPVWRAVGGDTGLMVTEFERGAFDGSPVEVMAHTSVAGCWA